MVHAVSSLLRVKFTAAVRCCAVLCGAVCVVRCDAVLCGAVLCCAARCCAVRCGAVRGGAVWCGAVLCGVVLCGVVDRAQCWSIDRRSSWSTRRRPRHRRPDRQCMSRRSSRWRNRTDIGWSTEAGRTVARPAVAKVCGDEAHHAASTRSSGVVTSFRVVLAIMSPSRPPFARCRRAADRTIFVIFRFYCKPGAMAHKRTGLRGWAGGDAPPPPWRASRDASPIT